MVINVLRGEMSIVGLRCHLNPPVISNSTVQLSLALRNSPLRPGLVNFDYQHQPSDLELRKIEADLFYISNLVHAGLDVKILYFRSVSPKRRTSRTIFIGDFGRCGREAKFLFQLLMGLLANPSCLDGGRQGTQSGRCRQTGEIVFLRLSRGVRR